MKRKVKKNQTQSAVGEKREVKKNKLMNLFVITIGARPPVLNCKRKMNKI